MNTVDSTVSGTASTTVGTPILKIIKTVAPKAPKPAPVPKVVLPPRMSYFYDSEGNKIAEQPSQRGAKPSNAIVMENGRDWKFENYSLGTDPETGEKALIAPLIVKPAKEKKQVFYITTDAMGNEVSRTPKGKGPTRDSYIKKGDGNYYSISAASSLVEPEAKSVSERAIALSEKLKAAKEANAEVSSEASAV